MINMFLFAWFILIIVVYFFLNNKINIKSKNLEERENFLKIQTDDFESKEKFFEEKYAAAKKELLDREIGILAYYLRALVERQEVKQTSIHGQNQVNLLRQQIKKMQTELENARQKSKRLAKKTKNAV
jgi:catalase (peroxidase I)